MVKYLPIRAALYCLNMRWTWFVALGIITAWIGVDFTDPIDWGDDPTSNGHWSALAIILLVWWIMNAVCLVFAPIIDIDLSHYRDYKDSLRYNNKFNDRNEKILAEAKQDKVNVYRTTNGLTGKKKELLRSFDVADDLEATDRAIEFTASVRSELEERKRKEKQQKKYVNKEAESLARVLNRG